MNEADAKQLAAELCRIEPIDRHLDMWRAWMRSRSESRGNLSKSAGFVAGGYSQSFDDMCARADGAAIRATDSIIESLAPAEHAAIWHWAGLTAVFRFPRNNYPALLETARASIWRELQKRGFV